MRLRDRLLVLALAVVALIAVVDALRPLGRHEPDPPSRFGLPTAEPLPRCNAGDLMLAVRQGSDTPLLALTNVGKSACRIGRLALVAMVRTTAGRVVYRGTPFVETERFHGDLPRRATWEAPFLAWVHWCERSRERTLTISVHGSGLAARRALRCH